MTKIPESGLKWHDKLVRAEFKMKREQMDRLRAHALDVERMMNSLSDELGVDLRRYEINWTTGECTPKPLPGLPAGDDQCQMN